MKTIILLVLLSFSILAQGPGTTQDTRPIKKKKEKKEKIKLGYHFLDVDILSIGGGSNYNGQIDILSVAYRTSFPGVGIKVNAVEHSLIEKSNTYTSYFVPYLLVPIRANKNSVDNSIIDGEVEFYFGGKVLNTPPSGYEHIDKIYYLNGGISVRKLFDVLELSALSLKIGYRSLFDGGISESTQFKDAAYGFITFHTSLFKTSTHPGSGLKKQIRKIAVKASLSKQINQRFFIIDGERLESSSSNIFNISILRDITKNLSYSVSYSNIGSVDEKNDNYELNSKSNSFLLGAEYNTFSLDNGFYLPVSLGAGAMILSEANYNSQDKNYTMPATISPLFEANIEPSYKIDFDPFDLSIFGRITANGSILLRDGIYDANMAYRLFGYGFGGGAKIEF